MLVGILIPKTPASALPDPALTDFSAADSNFAGGSANAQIQIGSDGDIFLSYGNKANEFHNTDTEWLAAADEGPGVGADYEVMLDTDGTGTTPSGPTLGDWHSLGFTRTWSLSQTGVGSKLYSNATLRIRKAGDAGSEVSCTVSISAIVTDFG